jgi:MFS family permease
MNNSDPSSVRLRFVLISAAVALSLLGDALLYALLPARPDAFGVVVWQVGVLLGANRFVRLITNELAGRWIQNSQSKGPLYWAVIIGALITASYALPIGFWGLLCARVLWGACWSVLRIEGYLSALAASSDSNRGRIFAVYQAATRLGQGGGLLIGGLLSELIGIPYTFLIFCLCSGSGVVLVRKTPPPVSDHFSERGEIPRKPSDRGKRAHNGFLSAAAARLGRWPIPLWGCGLCLTMVEQMVANLTGRFAALRIGPELPVALGIAGLSGLLLSFRSFASLLLGPLAGVLSDRLGRKRLLAGFVVLQSLCIAGLALLRPWQLLVFCLLLQFVCGVSARLLIYTIAGDLAPGRDRALHMSRFSTSVDLGTAMGPIVAFALYAGRGFLPVALVAWLLLAAVLALLLGCFEHEAGKTDKGCHG